MRKNTLLTTIAVAIVALSIQTPLVAGQPNNPKMFGKGAPFRLDDLPIESRLRKSLEAIPADKQQQALNQLHAFSFPENDVTELQTDEEGNVFYADEAPDNIPSSIETTTSVMPPPPPAINVFKLHSKPGSSNIVFLDFDGHIITGTAWNSKANPIFKAMPYDIETPANPVFNAQELSNIQEIWHRIAEDYAPFDIDVTTEEPSSFGPTVGRILFTKNADATGKAMPSATSGGVSYVNVWGWSDYATKYSPALVYNNKLGASVTSYIAETGAHEFGHNLGLSHDGVLDVTKNTLCTTVLIAYSCGIGSGFVSWAPIMGKPFFTNVTQWSKGEYPSANNTQDDLAIIAAQLGYRNDDIGNTMVSAKNLVINKDGSITATTPQDDPDNIIMSNKGIIETSDDMDVFKFKIKPGPLNITVTPAWKAFTRPDRRGANLDIQATLYNNAGIAIATSDPLTDTNATISGIIKTGGPHYLEIRGVGNSVTPYSNYGSMGEYFITGTVTLDEAAYRVDATPPTPNPMSFAVLPYANSPTQITMTATQATDDNGAVKYKFQCVAGGAGCKSSGWQDSGTYTATGLTPATLYSYQVTAKDERGNMTIPSDVSNATTLATDPL